MSEMVERVARAIAISDRCDPDKLAQSDPHLMMRSYRQYARAAIEAMRDVTEELSAALPSSLSSYAIFPAIIDEALK